MLVIAASCNCMQLQEKLIVSIWENGEKLHFEPDLGSFDPNLGPQFFFVSFYMLDIVAIC